MHVVYRGTYRCLFPSALEVLYMCFANSCDHVSVTGTEVYSVVQQIVPVHAVIVYMQYIT